MAIHIHKDPAHRPEVLTLEEFTQRVEDAVKALYPRLVEQVTADLEKRLASADTAPANPSASGSGE